METKIKKVLVSRFGDESVLQVIEANIASPQVGELQVQVLHSVVAGSDVNMRRGTYPFQKRAPLTPGYSMIGRVLENGPGVTAFAPGILVACLTIYGAQAERAGEVCRTCTRRYRPTPGNSTDPGLDDCLRDAGAQRQGKAGPADLRSWS